MNTRTALIGAGLVVVAIVLFIVLRGGGDDEDQKSVSGGAAAKSESGKEKGTAPSEKKPTVPTIVVGKDGKPVGGVAELTYGHGDEVRFNVRSAVADEIHVHGYDLMKDVEAGGTVSFDFPAEIEGIFEAELEGRGEQIVELKVEP
jgi:hypothetical protein